jgi:hypothetical protein
LKEDQAGGKFLIAAATTAFTEPNILTQSLAIPMLRLSSH